MHLNKKKVDSVVRSCTRFFCTALTKFIRLVCAKDAALMIYHLFRLRLCGFSSLLSACCWQQLAQCPSSVPTVPTFATIQMPCVVATVPPLCASVAPWPPSCAAQDPLAWWVVPRQAACPRRHQVRRAPRHRLQHPPPPSLAHSLHPPNVLNLTLAGLPLLDATSWAVERPAGDST